MADTVVNIFGTSVPAPAASQPPSEPAPRTKYAQIPLAEMSPEEKRAYFRDRAAAARKRKREAEEKQEEAKRLEAQQNRNDSWHQREAEDNAKPTPDDWDRILKTKTQPVIQKILDELQPWYYPPKRIEGNLILGLHGLVQNTVQELGAIIFGVPEKFFQMDGLGFRVAGYFPDSVMHEAVRLDKSILDRSKAWRDFYEQALRATVALMDQEKYKPFIGWTAAIRNELQNLHNDIDFAR